MNSIPSLLVNDNDNSNSNSSNIATPNNNGHQSYLDYRNLSVGAAVEFARTNNLLGIFVDADLLVSFSHCIFFFSLYTPPLLQFESNSHSIAALYAPPIMSHFFSSKFPHYSLFGKILCVSMWISDVASVLVLSYQIHQTLPSCGALALCHYHPPAAPQLSH